VVWKEVDADPFETIDPNLLKGAGCPVARKDQALADRGSIPGAQFSPYHIGGLHFD
jgi:hypothetical protein